MKRRVARAAPVEPRASDGHRETSPELAALAGRYLKFDLGAANAILQDDLDIRRKFVDDVRRLAASVLSQTEPKP